MNIRRTLLTSLLAALGGIAAGGAVLADDADEPTLKSLEKRTVEVRRESLPGGTAEISMEGYRVFLDSPLGGMMRREAMRRLADQMLERLEDVESGGAQTPDGSKDSYAEAIKLYNDALKAFPNVPGNEHIYYQLARAYEANGDPANALKALETVEQKHPHSIYAEEALFRRAELSFLLKSYAKAGAAYKQLLENYPKSPYVEISFYKYGWSLFKEGRYEPSLDVFFSLLDRSISGMRLEDFIADMPTLAGGQRELVKDTLRVISLAFSHAEGADSIYKYFAREGQKRDYEFLAYRDLGSLLVSQERYLDAAETYKNFVKNNPLHPQAPFFQLMAMEVYDTGRFPSLALEAKKVFARTYGLQEPFWDTQPHSLREQVGPYLRVYLDELARASHARAQASHGQSDIQEAIGWYRLSLKSFPKEKESAQSNFLLAELLFESGQFEQATKEYETTAYSYGNHPNAVEAGYAALLAYDEQKKLLGGESRNAWERKGIASAARFAKTNKRDARVPAILVKNAQEQFALGEREAAIASAQEVVNTHPQPAADLRLSASLVIGHAQFELGKFQPAELAYAATLKLMPENDARRADITERLAAAIYKQGEQQRDENKLRLAAQQFLRVAQVAPGSSIRYAADYDAAAALIAVKDWPAAIRVLEKFRDTPKGQELDLEVTQKLAVAYLENGDHRKAAAELEKLARVEGDEAVRREAAWRAGELYEKAKDTAAAILAWSRYVAVFPAPLEDKVEAQTKLAELNKGRQTEQYRYWLQQIIDTDREAGSQRTPRIQYMAARAAFELADPSYSRYKEVRLVAPIQENLKLKKETMQEAIKAYATASDYGIAEFTTASTYMIAEVYSDFSKALMQSERPQELSGDELEMYNVMLEEQAYPFEEKAIEIHDKNAQRTRVKVYDDWVKKSFTALSKLQPGRYAKQETVESYIDVLN